MAPNIQVEFQKDSFEQQGELSSIETLSSHLYLGLPSGSTFQAFDWNFVCIPHLLHARYKLRQLDDISIYNCHSSERLMTSWLLESEADLPTLVTRDYEHITLFKRMLKLT